MNEIHITGNAWVSDTARVLGNAYVFGNAHVFGNAIVSGRAWVFGNAVVRAGLIDGDAFITSTSDLTQVIVDDIVYSRFPQADGSIRYTSTGDHVPEPVRRCLDLLAASAMF